MNLEHTRSGEARTADDEVVGRKTARIVQRRVDESVAFAPHAIHDGVTVHTHSAPDAERSSAPRCVSDLGGGEQELTWHATDPRAGSASRAMLDEHHVTGTRDGGTVCSESR
jgi:hypothetical protein